MSSDSGPTAHIRLFDAFVVSLGERSLPAAAWPRRKAAALLKRLALERRLLKDQAIEYLWPDADPDSAANNLYKTLHVVRQTLEKGLGSGASDRFLHYADGVLRLDSGVQVDVHEFERRLEQAGNAPPDRRPALLEAALDLYTGDLLPDDLYEEWTQLPRADLRRRQRDVRRELSAHHRDREDFQRAVALLVPLLSSDPTDEAVHRELMRAYALSGNRQEALRQYQACVGALESELGVQPSPETTRLFERISAGELAPLPLPPLASLPVDTAQEQPRRVFVGRERQLGALLGHLDAAIEGQGGVVFVCGEAGQGKTSLLAEFADHALNHARVTVAAASCQSLAGFADSYLPFRDLLALLCGDWQRPWLGGEIPTEHARRLQSTAPEARRLVTASAPDLVNILVTTAAPQHRSNTGDVQPAQIFHQTWELLRSLAARQPLLLLLDDLHWIDAASASLLFYLVRQLSGSPVLIVGAYRPSEVRLAGSSHPLGRIVHELVQSLGDIRIDLDHTGPDEERRFLDALLDSEPNRLDTTFRAVLHRRTHAQPLFAVELLRALREQGALRRDVSGMWTVQENLDWNILPERVEAVIARRIEALPPELRRILAAASVEGETFSAQVLARVEAMDLRQLLSVLSQDLERGYQLVRERGEQRLEGCRLFRYQFRHILFQQYLYQQLGASERRLLHRETAAALEQLCSGDLETLAVTLSYHHLAAEEPARAVPYLSRAGDSARRRAALPEAAAYYQSALEHWAEQEPAGKASLLHRLGETLLAMGKASQAGQRFEQAYDLYRLAGSSSGMGAVQRLLGRTQWEQGAREPALAHYQQALRLLESEPEHPELARAVSALAQMHMLADEYDQAIVWGERALDLAARAELEDVRIHSMTTVGLSLVALGDAQRGLQMIAESQARAEERAMTHDACRAHTGWGDSLVSLERYEEARVVYERMLAYARKVGASMFEGVALVQLGRLEWWSGQWRAAFRRREAIIQWMADSPGVSMAKVWASNWLGLLDNDLGQPERARQTLEPFSEVARRAGEPQTTIPHLTQLARCAATEHERQALIQEILDLLDRTAYPRYEVLPGLHLACAWLVQATGDEAAALERLEQASHKMGGVQPEAVLAEVRALAAERRQDWEAAAQHAADAVSAWRGLSRPYELLRALTGQARALAAAGSKPEAHGAVRQEAAGIIARLSADLEDHPVELNAFLAQPLVRAVRGAQTD